MRDSICLRGLGKRRRQNPVRDQQIGGWRPCWLMVFVLLVGPTWAILAVAFGSSQGGICRIPASHCPNPVGLKDVNFYARLDIVLNGNVISWSPFVGMFIARVSRGRSVREIPHLRFANTHGGLRFGG